MRIALVVPAFFPARGYGGPAFVARDLACLLRDVGVEVEIITSTLKAPGDTSLRPGPDTVDGLHVYRMPTALAWQWSPWVRWRAPSGATDIVHVLGAWNGLSYAALRWGIGQEISTLWEPVGMLTRHGRHRLLRRWMASRHQARSDQLSGIIWTSPREREEAELDDHGYYWLRPNPVAEPPDEAADQARCKSRLDLDGRAPLWGYLGRIAHRKGVDTLLAAWAEADSPGRLVLAGPVEDRGLMRLARETPGVEALEALDETERWHFLGALDALLLMPAWGENFGNVVAEAVRIGTPALVSPAVGARHWLDEGVTVIEPASLATRLREPPPPRTRPALPEPLEPVRIRDRQLEIYREAIAGRP